MHSDIVNDVSYAWLAMRGDIVGLELWWRWDDEEKLGIVLSIGVGGATVTQVAQRHDVTRQQIYAWRHELKKKGLLSVLPEALFLPVELERRTEPSVPALMTIAEEWRPSRIELQLANALAMACPGNERSGQLALPLRTCRLCHSRDQRRDVRGQEGQPVD